MNKQSSSVILLKDNYILILKRNKEPYKGCWGLQGGKVEENETPQDAAIREVFEETNISCSKLKLLKEFLNPETGYYNYIFSTTHFEGVAENKEPEKHEAVQWFPVNKIPEKQGWSLRKSVELSLFSANPKI